MTENNFITIQGWMRTKLNLKGNDLMVYAIIYGFSQTENQRFTGSLQYLADWCGATKQGIQKNLKNLIEKGLIEKTDVEKNGVKFCEYSCIVYNSVAWGIQLSCMNKLENKQESSKKSSTKVLLENSETKTDFLGSVSQKKEEKPKKKNLYEKCIDIIDDYTDNKELRDALRLYLEYRLGIKDKPLYAGIWKSLITKLTSIDQNNVDTALAIVNQSIERGYLSFYPVNTYTNYKNTNCTLHDKINESGAVNVPHITEEEERELERLVESGELREY